MSLTYNKVYPSGQFHGTYLQRRSGRYLVDSLRCCNIMVVAKHVLQDIEENVESITILHRQPAMS